MWRFVRVLTAAACALAYGAAPAFAQVWLQGIGGVTNAGERDHFYAGSIGAGASFIEFDAEVGRFRNILPRGLVDSLRELEADAGLPVRIVARVPATYALGQLRFFIPIGPIRPFAGAGLGVARLEPEIDADIDGLTIADIFGTSGLTKELETLAMASAGVRLVVGHLALEGGYRYYAIFSRFRPAASFSGDRVLTTVNAAYGSVGIGFW